MNPSQLPKTFAGLVSLCMLKPIESKAECNAAQAVLDALMQAKQLTDEQQWYRRHLVKLATEYEVKNLSTDPTKRLSIMCEQEGITPHMLTEILGQSRGSHTGYKLLDGSRPLSKTHIKRLAEHFGVSTDCFF